MSEQAILRLVITSGEVDEWKFTVESIDVLNSLRRALKDFIANERAYHYNLFQFELKRDKK